MPTAEHLPPMLRTLIDGGICTIVADNPARLNAYTRDMWEALPKLVREAEDDPAVRVIVLRGAGTKAFSAGADILGSNVSNWQGPPCRNRKMTERSLTNGSVPAA